MKKRLIHSIVITVLLLSGVLVMRTMTADRSGGRDSWSDKFSSGSVSDAVSAAAGGNWGLSFQENGQPPIANATAEYLKQFNAWYTGSEKDVKDRCIYLTFDAGYENGYTDTILDVLKEEKVPAAFFLVGNYISENPELVKRMAAEGHLVGNHTMHHPDMSEIAEKGDFEKELKELESVYQEVTGHPMKKIYRPPQGKYSEVNLRHADELGYTTFFWSLAYVDWYEDKQPERTEAMNLLNSRIHPGAIVLLHSTSKTNADILAELIRKWKQDGYVFRSLEELTEKEPGMEDAGLF